MDMKRDDGTSYETSNRIRKHECGWLKERVSSYRNMHGPKYTLILGTYFDPWEHVYSQEKRTL